MKTRWILLALLLAFFLHGAVLGVQPTSVEVPIILYHKVSQDRGQLGDFCITPEAFEQDLQFLKNSEYEAVTMRQLMDFVAGDGDLPEKPIVLSFDDGYFSDYYYVFPLLLAYDIPIVSAIIGRVTDEYTAGGQEEIIYPHLTWPQMQEMAKSGLVEFQSHGYDLHHSRGGAQGAKQRRGESEAAYANRLGEDLMRLQGRFQEMLGEVPIAFAYPFGAKSESSDGVLKNLGFSASLTSASRKNTIVQRDGDSLFNLGRIVRPHGRALEEILGR